jgi:hypothetical protein
LLRWTLSPANVAVKLALKVAPVRLSNFT